MNFTDWLLMWAAKMVVQASAALALFALVVVLVLVFALRTYMRQRRCTHQRVRETMACDVVCNSCGKNLGFVGDWRDNKRDSK